MKNIVQVQSKIEDIYIRQMSIEEYLSNRRANDSIIIRFDNFKKDIEKNIGKFELANRMTKQISPPS